MRAAVGRFSRLRVHTQAVSRVESRHDSTAWTGALERSIAAALMIRRRTCSVLMVEDGEAVVAQCGAQGVPVRRCCATPSLGLLSFARASQACALMHLWHQSTSYFSPPHCPCDPKPAVSQMERVARIVQPPFRLPCLCTRTSVQHPHQQVAESPLGCLDRLG